MFSLISLLSFKDTSVGHSDGWMHCSSYSPWDKIMSHYAMGWLLKRKKNRTVSQIYTSPLRCDTVTVDLLCLVLVLAQGLSKIYPAILRTSCTAFNLTRKHSWTDTFLWRKWQSTVRCYWSEFVYCAIVAFTMIVRLDSLRLFMILFFFLFGKTSHHKSAIPDFTPCDFFFLISEIAIEILWARFFMLLSTEYKSQEPLNVEGYWIRLFFKQRRSKICR